jgi:hypothetical protein
MQWLWPARRAQINPGDVIAVSSAAVATKGVQMDLGGAQGKPEKILSFAPSRWSH